MMTVMISETFILASSFAIRQRGSFNNVTLFKFNVGLNRLGGQIQKHCFLIGIGHRWYRKTKNSRSSVYLVLVGTAQRLRPHSLSDSNHWHEQA